MNYAEIAAAIPESGVQEYDQSQEAVQTRIDIGNGVCRALAVAWLQAKKRDQDFWQRDGTVSQQMVAAVGRIQAAVKLQDEYGRVIVSQYVPDSATTDALATAGLGYQQNDVAASAQRGFAYTAGLFDEPAKISEHVLSVKSRFFILGIWGKDRDNKPIGHSIGVYRPYALIGKSSTMYLFDPNIGEFKVSGAANGKSLLVAINRDGYEAIRVDLNQQYMLWSFGD